MYGCGRSIASRKDCTHSSGRSLAAAVAPARLTRLSKLSLWEGSLITMFVATPQRGCATRNRRRRRLPHCPSSRRLLLCGQEFLASSFSQVRRKEILLDTALVLSG